MSVGGVFRASGGGGGGGGSIIGGGGGGCPNDGSGTPGPGEKSALEVIRALLECGSDHGRAAQVDPAWFSRLRLKYDELLSNFAFNFNLRRSN